MDETEYCRMQAAKSEPCAGCATLQAEVVQMSRDCAGFIVKAGTAQTLLEAEQRERKRLDGWLAWMDRNGVHTQTAFLKARNGAPVPE